MSLRRYYLCNTVRHATFGFGSCAKFSSQFNSAERERGQSRVYYKLLNEEWKGVPRIDAAVHLRNQFSSFEKKEQLNFSVAAAEVKAWLESNKTKLLFSEISSKLSSKLADVAHPSVYIAGDNVAVKSAFRDFLMRNCTKILQLIWLESDSILHIGSAGHHHDVGVMRLLAMDWYILSRVSVILAWRESQLTSTFVQSAHSMNTLDLSNCSSCQRWSELLVIKFHGNEHWVPTWELAP